MNKVNSRVELRFDIVNSALLTDAQKQVLLQKLATRITADGVLLLASQDDRSQLRNKEAAVARLYELLAAALKPVRKRRPTRPTRASVEKRIQAKRVRSERKSNRGKIDF